MGRAFSLVLGLEQTLAVIVISACRVLVGKVVMRMSSGSLKGKYESKLLSFWPLRNHIHNMFIYKRKKIFVNYQN